jgi:hypothetical protein
MGSGAALTVASRPNTPSLIYDPDVTSEFLAMQLPIIFETTNMMGLVP